MEQKTELTANKLAQVAGGESRKNNTYDRISFDESLCEGCGNCVSTCPVGAINMVNKVAIVNDCCVLCGACVDVCPCGAIIMQ